jgi:hypothetical protein
MALLPSFINEALNQIPIHINYTSNYKIEQIIILNIVYGINTERSRSDKLINKKYSYLFLVNILL